MKNFVILLTVISTAMFSCKKKDNETVSPSPNNSNTVELSDTVVRHTNAKTFHGIFSIANSTVYNKYNSTGYETFIAKAFFSKVATDKYNNNNYSIATNVENVTYKTEVVPFLSSMYMLNSSPIFVWEADAWVIKGANGIPSFSYIDTAAGPKFTGLNTLPDTINLSKGFSFSIDIASDFESGYIVFRIEHSDFEPFYNTLNAGNNTFVFSSAKLDSLYNGLNFENTTQPTAEFYIYITNSHAITVRGKNFQFNKDAEYTKGDIRITK